jgi:hypothetical protein
MGVKIRQRKHTSPTLPSPTRLAYLDASWAGASSAPAVVMSAEIAETRRGEIAERRSALYAT